MAASMSKATAMFATHFSKLVQPRTLLPSHHILLRTTTTSNTDTADATSPPPGDTVSSPSPKADDDVTAQLQKLNNDLQALNDKLTDTQDKYLRALAEVENVRQRLKKQVDEAKIFGIQKFCKDLLDVADVLGKANDTVPQEAVKSGDQHFRHLFEGLKMTEAQLQTVFTRHGLSQITPSKGDEFNPHFHEALFEVPTVDDNCGTIALLQKVGYKLNDRTIRPAQVGVFKAVD